MKFVMPAKQGHHVCLCLAQASGWVKFHADHQTAWPSFWPPSTSVGEGKCFSGWSTKRRDPLFLGLGFHRLLALVFHHRCKPNTSNDHVAINQTQSRSPEDPSFMPLIYSFVSWFASLSPAVIGLPCPLLQGWKPPNHPPGSGPLTAYWSLSCSLPRTNFSGWEMSLTSLL